jgi:REP element-mobilizing transposase RayT
MKRDGIELTPEAREHASRAMVAALKFHGVEVLAWSVGRRHYHGLIRCPNKTRNGRSVVQALEDHMRKSLGTAAPRLWRNRVARHFVGIAKKESARALSREGLAPPGGVWTRGCGVKPIRDRNHQVNVVGYIRDHQLQGAFVYLWFNPPPDIAR